MFNFCLRWFLFWYSTSNWGMFMLYFSLNQFFFLSYFLFSYLCTSGIIIASSFSWPSIQISRSFEKKMCIASNEFLSTILNIGELKIMWIHLCCKDNIQCVIECVEIVFTGKCNNILAFIASYLWNLWFCRVSLYTCI